jgi:DNA-binding XRE family transcriptional regulator
MPEFPKITLEAARVNAHLSQKDAAKGLGISPETLRSYENGKREITLQLARKLADMYQFPLQYIFIPDVSV